MYFENTEKPMILEQFEQALGGRGYEQGIVAVSDIVFSEEFGRSCAVCCNYNTRWNCPPVVDSMEEQKKRIRAYRWAFVFSTTYATEGPFDFEGMFFTALGAHRTLTIEMYERFGRKHPIFGAGGCHLCKHCAYPEPCRFPGKVVSSIEAAGIDVTRLSRSAGLTYNNGENTVTYFSMILFNE
jgi:predicted metal-binding protein